MMQILPEGAILLKVRA